jgi:hypothetical protein
MYSSCQLRINFILFLLPKSSPPRYFLIGKVVTTPDPPGYQAGQAGQAESRGLDGRRVGLTGDHDPDVILLDLYKYSRNVLLRPGPRPD